MREGRREQQRPLGGPGMGPGRGFRPGGPMMMGMPVQKAKDFKGTLKRLLRYLKPQRCKLALVFLMAICSTVFSIISPKLIGQATTKLFDGVLLKIKGVPGAVFDFSGIWHLVLILGGLYLFSALFNYLQQFLMAGVAQKTVYQLRREVSEKLTRLPLKFFDTRTNGEILSRVTNDVDNIASTMQQSITQLISALITLAGVIVMMLTISPLMTLVAVLTVPLSFFAIKSVAPRSQKFFIGQQKALGELNGHVEEMYTGHRIIKAFGHEAKSIGRFEEINERLYQSGFRAQFISGMIMPLMSFITNIGYVLVCVVGGVLVMKKSIEIGDIQAFIQYARQFSMPITQTANIANIIQSTIASAERVFELLDEPEEVPEAEHPLELAAVKGEVRFEQVRFGYQPDALLMHNLNLAVQPGQTVAVVGPTGAGKTTLINLLMRFYELNGGQIKIDGANITQFKRGPLRRLFGMVLQDTWLFHGTIRENIAYGRPDATEAEIVQAARAAHADHFIRTLPDGYETVLNEDASNVSQGQKQLLTIARAILADPAILILDEATSSVDTRTEVAIQKAMNELMRGRTSFVIAHRLSTIRDADVILVMRAGDVVETGRHEELLAKGGFYAELYNSQFAKPDREQEAG